jgi:hypothetical protein
MSLNTAACPVCQTPISATRFAEIQEQIRAEETAKFEQLRVQFQVEAEAKAAVAIDEASRRFSEQAEARVGAALASLAELTQRLQDEKKLRSDAESERLDELKKLKAESQKLMADAVSFATAAAEKGALEKIALLEVTQEGLQRAIADAREREASTDLTHAQQMKAAVDASREEAQVAQRRESEQLRDQIAQILRERDAISQSAAAAAKEHQLSIQTAVEEANAKAAERYALEIAKAFDANAALLQRLESSEKQVQDQESRLNAELQEQRQILDEAKSVEISKIRADQLQDNEALRKKLAEAERKLDQKTTNDLGQIPEDQLERDLRAEFREDDIFRVKRGQPGADLIVTVKYKGDSCGKIVIDSKNHLSWRDTFCEKLAQDCLEAEAKHSILSTVAFPRGSKDLSVKDGVILAKPNQVVALVDVLRKTMIQNHVTGLSVANEGQKKDRLYQLITSDSYRQNLEISDRIMSELQQIDIDETSAHKKVWEQRGARFRKLDRLMREANDSIAAIVESTEVVRNETRVEALIRTRVPIQNEGVRDR